MHGRLRRLPFSGESMKPLLITGDEILFEGRKQDIKIGDVLLFKDPFNSEFVVHRAISLNPLCTKGDWSCHFENISYENVFGVVRGFLREGDVFLFSEKKFFIKFFLFFSKKLLSKYRGKRWPARLCLIFLCPFMSFRSSGSVDF